MKLLAIFFTIKICFFVSLFMSTDAFLVLYRFTMMRTYLLEIHVMIFSLLFSI